MQLMAVTLLFALLYLIYGLKHSGDLSMPDIPTVALVALLGSQGAFLTGKYRGG